MKSEQLQTFASGCKALDIFLTNYARQNDKKDIAKTFIGLEGGKVIGFFSLYNASLEFSDVPDGLKKHLPRYPIPCIRIARLAVAYDEQGHGYGTKLLSDALYKILVVSELTGTYFAIVDAKESSKTFYEQFGFEKIEDHKLTYMLSVATIRKTCCE